MQSMGFRSDINFLRAIAVVLVVVFHFSNVALPGGFVGVDIFFAISGYLMTGIIFSQIQYQRFSLLSFYLARAKRIIPALSVMVLSVLVYAWFYLFDVEFIKLLKHAFSSLLFYSNVVYWQEAGYFSASAHQNWLLHTWSLSVEWQFYMVYPIILLLLTKVIGLRWTKLLIILGAIASFAAAVYASNIWPDPAYFSLPTRAWQMMVGGIAFLYPVTFNTSSQRAVSLLGLAIMLISAAWVSPEMNWPAWPSALPILGAYLFLIADASKSLPVYNTAVFKYTGRWSYSIYLWHWPVVVWMNNQSFAVDVPIILGGIALSVVLGALSFWAIESRRVPVLHVVIFAAASTFAATANSFGLGETSLRTLSHSPSNTALYHYEAIRQKMADENNTLTCRLSSNKDRHGNFAYPAPCIDWEQQHGLLFWGDSHAESFSRGVLTGLPQQQSVSRIFSSGCRPSFDMKVGDSSVFRRACDQANETARTFVSKQRPDTVMIGMKDQHEMMDWDNIIAFLKANGTEQIIVIGPTPQYYPTVPLNYVKQGEGETLISYKLDYAIPATDAKLASILADYDVRYISLFSHLCEKSEDAYRCRVKLNGELYSFDYGHLTPESARILANELLFDPGYL